MSDTHVSETDAHDDHAPEPRELTHPALWTLGLVLMALFLVWLFFHYLVLGNSAARGEPEIAQLMADSGGGAPEPDHLALIDNKSEDVLAKGQALFAKQCASCHGINGDLKGGTSPQARNFHTDEFKNPKGKGPYALYLVVTNGFNAMPPFKASLDPASRYAVIQYIRETWVKTDNAKNYVEKDRPDVLAEIPKTGAADASAANDRIPPNERPVPVTLQPLMAAMAQDSEAQLADLRTWAEATVQSASADVRPDAGRFRTVVTHNGALGAVLQQAAKAGDVKRFTDVLVHGQVPGTSLTEFAVMSTDRLNALYAVAHAAAEGSH